MVFGINSMSEASEISCRTSAIYLNTQFSVLIYYVNTIAKDNSSFLQLRKP